MNYLFHPFPIRLENGITFLRIVIGAMMAYHGFEVFDAEVMSSYLKWEQFNGADGKWMVYVGKSSEFITGVLLILGLLTRIAAFMLIGTMSYITFFLGHGKFWYEDQHPFMFVLFGILFFLSGPGLLSLDGLISRSGRTRASE